MTDRLIYESKKSKVFRREAEGGGDITAVKVINYEFPTPADIAQFHNEYDIISGLRLAGVRNAIRKTRENNRHVLEMEWVDGESLKSAFRHKSGDIVDVLYIFTACARALAEIHQHHIIHKDVSPLNILVDLQERRVWLIDFGISTNLDLKQPYVSNPELIEGTLAYCAPEQTGRMNRTVDFRADLYSLGVTFYEVLAGALPYQAADAMEMVHAHLAQVPPPVRALNPKVPAALSDIISKLLAKDPDDRYQSAHGLQLDLELCLTAFQKGGAEAANFPLGRKDHSTLFRLPQRLYGREQEVMALIQAFERAAEGDRRLMLVAGYSGTGKTALVHEVHKPITARRGYFSSGKFDQFQRATPYFAFIEAFKDLVDALLTEREERLHELRTRLQAALGQEGRVLTNVLPNLEHIIGPQPAIPEVGGAEAQNRFNYLFRKFVRALCTAEHPIVIFIDDFQWADSASLKLLHVLMSDAECGHLLLVGAYRENEVSASHPFIQTVETLRSEGTPTETLRITNLREDDLRAMLADALSATTEAVSQLARTVMDKTQGNAFFATEFLKSLAVEKLLVFDLATARWQWDATLIAQKNIADNVVDLMAGKVRRLDLLVQQSLRLASCIGSRFDLETLSVVHQREAEDEARLLKVALGAGLIVQLDAAIYKFSHDRVQQAVYSLIAEEERTRVHLEIGQLLLASIPVGRRESRIFDLTNQLNNGRSLITARSGQIELAELNFQAGSRAKLNSAFIPALQYFETGIALMEQGAEPWQEVPLLTRELFTEATEAAYLSGEFQRMDQHFRTLLTRVEGILDKVKPYEVRILAYKAENRFHEAIETGLEVLAQLGEHFPARPNPLHIVKDLIGTKLALSRCSTESLMALPLMQQPEKMAAMRIIADITSSVYWGRPNLLPLIVFRMVRLSLKYGNHPVSCFAYGSYGVIMCGVLGQMQQGARYGRLALDLLEKLHAKEWKAQIYVSPYALTFHWTEHVKHSLRPLQESFQIGLETGLIEFACVNTNIYCIHAFLCGRPLERTEEETRAYSVMYRQFKQETNLNYNEVYRQAMLNLMGRSSDPVRLTGEAYDEERMIQQNHERSDKTGTFFIHFNKLLLCYLFRRFEEAYTHARAARGLLDAVLAKFEIPNHHFYEALTALALAEKQRGMARWSLLRQVRRNMAKLRRWAQFSPANYRHKHDLCRAEYARVSGQDSVARLAYDRAISGATEGEFIHEQALAFELAGRYYAETGRPVLTEFHLKAAYNAYREWGATAKLRDLAERFPKYLSQTGQGLSAISSEGRLDVTTSMLNGAVLDITTVLKASTTISREVVPSNLLAVLMQIVIENAGAQRGFILLDGPQGLRIQARGEEGGTEITVLQDQPAEACADLSFPHVQFVHRTGEPVVIADAATDSRCESQPYIRQRRPVSLLCVPIVNRGRSVGVLYLENNLAPGTFTSERVDLLTLLSGQIAVSIDNAMLYEKLEQKVAERTTELEQEKRRTDDLLHSILPAETAAELKQHGRAEARHYERVTVLFTDFKGFTELSARLSPADLVRELDECFHAFDEIVGRHGVEKIKTIGDAYMAVGGLPVPNSTHAEDVVLAALEMRDYMDARNARPGGVHFGIRIGVHTGPVVAGIVGSKKFQYDVWGDTVNTAARMESSGEVGRVNISQATHDLICPERFHLTPRGEREAKGKGLLTMFFVEPTPPPTAPDDA